jgi:hypothetical protein
MIQRAQKLLRRLFIGSGRLAFIPLTSRPNAQCAIFLP